MKIIFPSLLLMIVAGDVSAIERLVVRASDCQAMADVGFGLHGALTLTFRDGLLASSEIIDLAPLIDACRKRRPEDRLSKVMRFERSA